MEGSCVNSHSSIERFGILRGPRVGEWIAYRLTDVLGDWVIGVVNTVDNKRGGLLEATRGLEPVYLDWVPEGFLSVSPSPEKQTTLWGRLKQSEDASK